MVQHLNQSVIGAPAYASLPLCLCLYFYLSPSLPLSLSMFFVLCVSSFSDSLSLFSLPCLSLSVSRVSRPFQPCFVVYFVQRQ